VQVDGRAPTLGDGEQPAQVGLRVGREVRGAADGVDVDLERRLDVRVRGVLAGELDQVVPLASTRLVAERIPGAHLITDPLCGHTVRSSFRGYDGLVESFLADGG